MSEIPKPRFAKHKRTVVLLMLLVSAAFLFALAWAWGWNRPRYHRLRLNPSHLETNAVGRPIAVFLCTNPYPVRIHLTCSVHSYDKDGREWATPVEGPFDVDPSDVFTLRAYAPTNDCLWRFVVFHTVPLDGIDELRDRWGRGLAAHGWNRVSDRVISGNLHQPAIMPLLTNHQGQVYIVREPQ